MINGRNCVRTGFSCALVRPQVVVLAPVHDHKLPVPQNAVGDAETPVPVVVFEAHEAAGGVNVTPMFAVCAHRCHHRAAAEVPHGGVAHADLAAYHLRAEAALAGAGEGGELGRSPEAAHHVALWRPAGAAVA